MKTGAPELIIDENRRSRADPRDRSFRARTERRELFWWLLVTGVGHFGEPTVGTICLRTGPLLMTSGHFAGSFWGPNCRDNLLTNRSTFDDFWSLWWIILGSQLSGQSAYEPVHFWWLLVTLLGHFGEPTVGTICLRTGPLLMTSGHFAGSFWGANCRDNLLTNRSTFDDQNGSLFPLSPPLQPQLPFKFLLTFLTPPPGGRNRPTGVPELSPLEIHQKTANCRWKPALPS